MQFSGQPTGISRISQKTANKFFRPWDRLSILAASGSSRISAREKGSTTWCANGTLAVSTIERHPAGNQGINIWRVDEGIAKCMDGVTALLIGANPENIRLLRHLR